jgi:hypothetical protein
MILTISSEETVDTDNLTIDGLRDLSYRMGEDIDSIEYQIESAQVKARTNGEYSDGQWYAKAQYALRRKRKTVEFIKQIQGERRRERNMSLSTTLASLFVDVAREKLPDHEFEVILREAKELFDKSRGD